MLCPRCELAEYVLGRDGFRDKITWGRIGGSPNDISHAFHSNSKLAVGGGFTNLLCVTYASEIRWVMAERPARPMVYMAHPVSGRFAENVKSAGVWLRWLRSLTTQQLSNLTGCFYKARPVIMAPWLGGIASDSKTPGGREAVIADCVVVAAQFCEVWAVRELTPGVREEGEEARIFRDLTWLGKTPPRDFNKITRPK